MAVRYAYTLEEAKAALAAWKECESELAAGTAKEYTIGNRVYKAIDLPYIREQIQYFSDIIEMYTENRRKNRVARVVFRDL